MRWFFNNLQFLLPVLFVIGSVGSRWLKSAVEQKRLAEAQRGGPRPAQRDPAGAMLQPSEVSAQNRSPETRQSELAAQRQAQIEMWRARQAALGGPVQSPSSTGDSSVEEDLANRRRQAMEELRRRQIQVDQMRARQTGGGQPSASAAPTSRRPITKAEGERRLAAQRRRGPAPVTAPSTASSRSSIIGDVIAATAAPPHPQSRVVPASRTTPAGLLVLSPESLRQAFIMKELLDPPVALRDNSTGGGFGYDPPI